MSKDKLNSEDVVNELSNGSVFFPNKASQKVSDQLKKSNHDTVIPRNHDTIIENIRKAVKSFGKEAATHRFTLEEKQKIADVIYTYKRHGMQTSENEITRIAINFVVNDHTKNGENSILGLVLKALNE